MGSNQVDHVFKPSLHREIMGSNQVGTHLCKNPVESPPRGKSCGNFCGKSCGNIAEKPAESPAETVRKVENL